MFWFYLCLGTVLLTACSLTAFILTRLGVRMFDLKKQADLVYRAMRRERDVLVLFSVLGR